MLFKNLLISICTLFLFVIIIKSFFLFYKRIIIKRIKKHYKLEEENNINECEMDSIWKIKLIKLNQI